MNINTFSNFIPNIKIIFDARDLPWMNDFLKTKTNWKNGNYKT